MTASSFAPLASRAYRAETTADGTAHGRAIMQAIETDTPLRIVGSGTWLHAGRAVGATATLDMRSHSGIVEYVPGDLVLTARAGTTLDEIASATREHFQWLPLDPYGSGASTLGAIFSTASHGPLARGYGRARDIVLGLSAVTGRGEPITVGGRVVKNVAGFDLVRLLVGSWGTLAAITDVSVRLHALPEHDVTLAIPIAPASLSNALKTFGTLRIAPVAVQLLSASLARRVLGDDFGSRSATMPVLLVRLVGNGTRIDAQRERLENEFGSTESVADSVWRVLRESHGYDAAAPERSMPCFRAGNAPSRLGATWQALVDTCGNEAWLDASLHDGIVRCTLSAPRVTDDLLSRLGSHGLSQGMQVIGEVLPPPMFAQLDARRARPLDGALRRAFNPHDILNPGAMPA